MTTFNRHSVACFFLGCDWYEVGRLCGHPVDLSLPVSADPTVGRGGAGYSYRECRRCGRRWTVRVWYVPQPDPPSERDEWIAGGALPSGVTPVTFPAAPGAMPATREEPRP